MASQLALAVVNIENHSNCSKHTLSFFAVRTIFAFAVLIPVAILHVPISITITVPLTIIRSPTTVTIATVVVAVSALAVILTGRIIAAAAWWRLTAAATRR